MLLPKGGIALPARFITTPGRFPDFWIVAVTFARFDSPTLPLFRRDVRTVHLAGIGLGDFLSETGVMLDLFGRPRSAPRPASVRRRLQKLTDSFSRYAQLVADRL